MAVATLKEHQSDLPSQESTKSYWHQEPSKKLLGYRSTAELPPTADVVVVGSGITGSFAARELVKGGRSVVMLEAREACWGATGRVSYTVPSLKPQSLKLYGYLDETIHEGVRYKLRKGNHY